MELHSDLLAQADHLAAKEPKKPKQASLRRAASAAYYAVFHFLIDQATRFLVSGGHVHRVVLRHALARCFNHKQMMTVCKAFAGTDNNVWKALFSPPVPPDLVMIASTVVDLQQARHEADYDLTRDFTRSEVRGLITQARQAIHLWPNIAASPHAEGFLLALLINTRK